jgi:hypothetical protein
LENESLKREGLCKREYFAAWWRGGMMLFESSLKLFTMSLEVNCIKIST